MVAGLRRTVGEQQPGSHAGIDPAGQRRGDGADIAVHHHRHAPLGGGDTGARQGGDLQPSQAAQGFQRLDTVFPVPGQGQFHRRPLADQTGGVDPGAGPHGGLRRQIHQCAGQSCRGRGVADAHFAGDKELAVADLRDTGFQGRRQLRCRHGVTPADIAAAGGHVPRAYQRVRPVRRGQGVRGAQVHHQEIRPQLAGQHRDGGPTPGEVADHLHGHGLGKGGYPLGDHPVIGGEYPHPAVFQGRPIRALPAGQIHRQLLQPPQRAGGFGQLVLARRGPVPAVGVDRGHGGLEPGQGVVFCCCHFKYACEFGLSSASYRSEAVGLIACTASSYHGKLLR